MEHIVSGCKDCCFYFLEDSNDSLVVYNYCLHPNHKTITVQDIDLDENNEPITPDFCPLNSEPITIIKK